MYCKYCGKENKDGQKFCKYCGGSFQKKISVSTPEPEQEPKPVTLDETYDYDYDYEPEPQVKETVEIESVESSLRELTRGGTKPNESQKKRKKNNNRALIIIASASFIMVVVALGIFLVLYFSHKEKEPLKRETVVNDVSTKSTEVQSEVNSQPSEVKWEKEYVSELDEIKNSYHLKMVDYLKGLYGGDADNSFRTNADHSMRFELLDVNGDGISEMFSYDMEGLVTWITTYVKGETVSTILYDNCVKPSGFNDYGAYASIDVDHNKIYRYEYDTTLYENGGMNLPGREWIEIDNRPFEYFIYVTVFEISSNGSMEETDRYMCHYHFNQMEGKEYIDYYGVDEGEFVEATHNDDSISQEEFNGIGDGSSNIYFGSPQDGANGYNAGDIKRLLDGEKLLFTVNSIDENRSEAEVYRIEDGISDYQCLKFEKLSNLPSGVKEGDFITYSLKDGWSIDETPEIATEDDGRNEAYAQIVREYYALNQGGCGFDLIYFDEDDLPELVTNKSGDRVSLYTYSDGEVVKICDEWPYGAWGNAGYEYFPNESIIYNINSDYAGAMYWEYYEQWNPETREFKDLNDKSLCLRRFDDKNGDGVPDEDEYLSDDEELIYYYGDQQVSEEEYESYKHKGDTKALSGSMTYEQILNKLGSPAGDRLKIVGASATSELNVASKDNATYIATNASDGDIKTAWVEGVDGNGEGQSITLYLDGVHNISRLKIYNGYMKNKRRYAINGKVTKAIIDYGNGYQQTVNVNTVYVPEEEADFEPYEIIETVVVPEQDVSTDTITITIEEATAGSTYHDTAISEIIVYE